MERDREALGLIKAQHGTGGSLCTPAGELPTYSVVLAGVAAALIKAAEDQARDENGRFASGGGGSSVDTGSATERARASAALDAATGRGSSAPTEPVSVKPDEGFGREFSIRGPASAGTKGPFTPQAKPFGRQSSYASQSYVTVRGTGDVGTVRGPGRERGTYRVADTSGREAEVHVDDLAPFSLSSSRKA